MSTKRDAKGRFVSTKAASKTLPKNPSRKYTCKGACKNDKEDMFKVDLKKGKGMSFEEFLQYFEDDKKVPLPVPDGVIICLSSGPEEEDPEAPVPVWGCIGDPDIIHIYPSKPEEKKSCTCKRSKRASKGSDKTARTAFSRMMAAREKLKEERSEQIISDIERIVGAMISENIADALDMSKRRRLVTALMRLVDSFN